LLGFRPGRNAAKQHVTGYYRHLNLRIGAGNQDEY
jgi:hypothetical protein